MVRILLISLRMTRRAAPRSPRRRRRRPLGDDLGGRLLRLLHLLATKLSSGGDLDEALHRPMAPSLWAARSGSPRARRPPPCMGRPGCPRPKAGRRPAPGAGPPPSGVGSRLSRPPLRRRRPRELRGLRGVAAHARRPWRIPAAGGRPLPREGARAWESPRSRAGGLGAVPPPAPRALPRGGSRRSAAASVPRPEARPPRRPARGGGAARRVAPAGARRPRYARRARYALRGRSPDAPRPRLRRTRPVRGARRAPWTLIRDEPGHDRGASGVGGAEPLLRPGPRLGGANPSAGALRRGARD